MPFGSMTCFVPLECYRSSLEWVEGDMMLETTLTRREFLSTAAAGATGPPLQRKRAVIDCRTHVGTASTLTAPWTTIANPEEILRRNREAGIDKACVFPISHDTFEEANREVAAIARRHRDRFIGFAKHDPVREKGRIR